MTNDQEAQPPAKIALIVNPTAGRGRAGRLAQWVRETVEALGGDAELLVTGERGDAGPLASGAIDRGAKIVAAVGGDGTLHDVANAVLAADTRHVSLGLVPIGTGNDFARGVGLHGDIRRACRTLIRGTRSCVDIGRIEAPGLAGGRWFLVASGLGFVADTAAVVNNGVRFLSGAAAYLYGAAHTLLRMHPFEIGIKVDGRDLRLSEATLVSVSNVPTTGGGLRIAPGADPRDGVFDVCVVGKVGRLELLGQLPALTRGEHIHHPSVTFVQGQHIEIATSVPKALWIDGEVVGETPVTFRMSRGILPMMLPTSRIGERSYQ